MNSLEQSESANRRSPASGGSASGFWRSARGENHGRNSMPGDVWVVPGDITDTDRLNWIEEHCTYKGGGNGGVFSFSTPLNTECFRAALDAAMMPNDQAH